MNWINALSWPQWLLLAAIPPAVLSLYFLKLKRKSMEVPSTLLWKKTLEDLHVNSIWQRLKNNLLLYLQLAFLGLVILACLRPGWSGQDRMGERRIYIIDNSASMQSSDSIPNRLEEAKSKVKDLLSNSGADDVAMVIAFSDRADVRQGFTKDKNRLIAAVDSIRPTNHPTDISEALRAAAGLANPGRSSFDNMNDVQVADAIPATVYLLSDGAFGDLGEIDLGRLKIEYLPVGKKETPNLAILSFSVQRKEDTQDQLEAFARVGNFSSEEITCTASLELNGQLADASTLRVEANSESAIVFELTQLEQGELKLILDHNDALMIDNVAFAAIRPAKPISVLLITSGNTALETALTTGRCQRIANVRIEPTNFLTDPAYMANETESLFDLIIYDQCAPDKLPSSSTLFIGAVPPRSIANDPSLPETAAASKNQEWIAGNSGGPIMILDVNRTNPVTQYLEMGAVKIYEGTPITPPQGGSVLMTSDLGPVFAVAPRGAFQDAVLGFPIVRSTDQGVVVNTDWGIRRSFPVWVYSCVEYLGGGITEASAPTVSPGSAIGLTLSKRFNEYTVVSPKEEKTQLERNDDSRFVFTKTEDVGTYKIFTDDPTNPVETFCVNLFSNKESDLTIAESVSMGAEKIAANESSIRSRKELWRWLLLLGLGLLMLEWIIFNRRIFV